MATDIEKVRLLIPDKEQVFDGDYLFSDADITGYLEIAGSSVLRAAGFAKIAVGDSEAMIGKVIRTQDLQTDASKLADSWRKSGEVLLARADKEDEANGFYFNIVDFAGDTTPELTEFANPYATAIDYVDYDGDGDTDIVWVTG